MLAAHAGADAESAAKRVGLRALSQSAYRRSFTKGVTEGQYQRHNATRR